MEYRCESQCSTRTHARLLSAQNAALMKLKSFAARRSDSQAGLALRSIEIDVGRLQWDGHRSAARSLTTRLQIHLPSFRGDRWFLMQQFVATSSDDLKATSPLGNVPSAGLVCGARGGLSLQFDCAVVIWQVDKWSAMASVGNVPLASRNRRTDRLNERHKVILE